MLDLDLTLKNNELCLVGRAADRGGMQEAGLYLRDTRFLSLFRVSVSGTALEPLSSLSLSATEAIIVRVPRSPDGESPIPDSGLVVVQRIALGTSLEIDFELQAFGDWVIGVDLEIQLASDFRDMFDVRGMHPSTRPALNDPHLATDHRVTLAATGSDGERIQTEVKCTPTPSATDIALVKRGADGDVAVPVMLSFHLDLASNAARNVHLSIRPYPVGPDPELADDDLTRLSVASSNTDLNAFVEQSDRDLAMLQTSFPEGAIPAAGIPWYIAPFGRDSLIVALQTMHVYPERVWATLQVLAANQGAQVDAYREEEPGKILHELRYGDMARSGQIPHTPYFGSIDSTPLFLMTFATAYRWHEDEETYDALIPHVHRALAWLEDYGDLDGDGLIEFGAKVEDGVHISQQGWKDSSDSLNWADGSPVEGPVALVEVQGYLYAAYAWLAEVADMRSDRIWGVELRSKAERVRLAVEEHFWLEEERFYAQALDGQKRPVNAISSNPGHLLFCGLPSRERAAAVVDRLLQNDMLTRWGIRTLSSEMSTYNPSSYHNGSIWPHDNSMIMWGMKSYEFNEASSVIAEALIRLSTHDPERRLSELYCGFDFDDDRVGPVNYPVSCRPQAWAAGCGPLLVRTIFGLERTSDTYGIASSAIGTDIVTNMSVNGIRARGEEWELRMANGEAFDTHVHHDDGDDDVEWDVMPDEE